MHHQHCFNGCVLRRSSRENAISAQVEFENTAGWRAPTALILPETSPPHPKSTPELPKASPKRPQSVPRVFPERPRSVPGERRLEVTKSHLARVSRRILFFALFSFMQSCQKMTRSKGPWILFFDDSGELFGLPKGAPTRVRGIKKKRNFGSGGFCDFCSVALTEEAGGSQ